MRTRTALAAAVTVLLLVGAGCGQKVAEKAAETAINNKLGTNGSVDLNNGTVTYQGKNGDTVSYGQKATIPADFPKDVPVYPGASVNVAAVQGSNGGASLSLHTTDKVDAVLAWYASQLSAWKQQASYSAGGQEMRSYLKDGVTISILATGANDGTTVTIGRSVEPKPQQ